MVDTLDSVDIYWWSSSSRDSVHNGSWQPASSPVLHRKDRLVWFLNHSNIRPTASWQAKLIHIPYDRWGFQDCKRPVQSNVRFCVRDFTIFVTFRCGIVKRNIFTLVRRLLFWMCWLPWWLKHTETRTLPHHGNNHQKRVRDCGPCILSNLEGNRLHLIRNIVSANFLENRESYTLPTPSGTSVWTEGEHWLHLHLWKYQGHLITSVQEQGYGSLDRESCKGYLRRILLDSNK